AGNAVLDPVNVQAALGQLDLLPLQVADLRGPQAVAVGDQDHGGVPMPVAAMLASPVHQALDLTLRTSPRDSPYTYYPKPAPLPQPASARVRRIADPSHRRPAAEDRLCLPTRGRVTRGRSVLHSDRGIDHDESTSVGVHGRRGAVRPRSQSSRGDLRSPY